MSEKIDDNSLIDDIEGLLFSEEFADSEDNSSIISEIASSEILERSDESDENTENPSKKETDKDNPEKTSVEEIVLNIAKSDNFFEIDFNFASLEKIRNSIWASKKINHSTIGLEKPKYSVREGLAAQTLRDSFGGCKEQKCPLAEIEKASFFIRKGFEAESLRKFIWDKQEIFKPLIESDDSIFPMGVSNNPKESSATIENGDDSKFSDAYLETYKVPRQPSDGVEKSNVSIELEKKKVARESLCADSLNNFVETHKETRIITERSSSGKLQLLDSETNCIEKLKPSSTLEKIKISIEPGKQSEKERVFYESVYLPETVGFYNTFELFSESVKKKKTSVGFQKSSVQKNRENSSEIVRETKGDYKEKKAISANVEKNKNPLGWERTNCLIGSEKTSAVVKKCFEPEPICQMQTNKDVKSFFVNSKTTKNNISLNETRASVASENRKSTEEIDQTKNLECSEKKKTVLNEKNSAKPLHNSADCNKSINESFASIKKKEEIVDVGKSKVSLNKKNPKTIDAGVAPSPKINELKKERKNIVSSSAVSITANNNLDLASSASNMQEKNFFSTIENRKKNLPRKKAFDDFNKRIKKQTSQIRVSSLPLKNDGFVSKLNGDRTFDKKEMSLLYDKRKTAYKNMERDFKYKKDLF